MLAGGDENDEDKPSTANEGWQGPPEPLEGNIFPSIGPGPKDNPVSAAVRIPRGARYDHWRRILGAIDSVHGDGGITQQVEVIDSPNLSKEGGYKFIGPLGPIHIAINTLDRPEQELTLVHEIGHFIDHIGLSPLWDFASDASPLLGEWRRAAFNSDAIRRLQEVADTGRTTVIVKGVEVSVPGAKDRARQWITEREIWARCYAQYIAVKSGDPVLMQRLNGTRGLQGGMPRVMPQHWEDEDFQPIMQAMDRVFQEKGWR